MRLASSESVLPNGCDVDFTQVDVFTNRPYEGNPLAVFHDASELDSRQMQTVAREMNLSETTFVTRANSDSYEVRIFTPVTELPFAGHPTIGTAWTLLEKGIVKGKEITQRSRAGETPVRVDGDVLWIEREGRAEADLEERDPNIVGTIAKSLGIDRGEVGLEARELGRSGRLRPAFADGGLRQLMVPVRDRDALRRCVPPSEADVVGLGAYCFTAEAAGRIAARGFWPAPGIPEDPATGAAAIGLGLYLADRVGDVQLEVLQGQEINRPSRILLRAQRGKATIGGRCVLVYEGKLAELP